MIALGMAGEMYRAREMRERARNEQEMSVASKTTGETHSGPSLKSLSALKNVSSINPEKRCAPAADHGNSVSEASSKSIVKSQFHTSLCSG